MTTEGRPPQAPFDAVQFLIDFDTLDMTEEHVIAGFQKMIDSGLVWKIEGRYGRIAAGLIKQGVCHAS